MALATDLYKGREAPSHSFSGFKTSIGFEVFHEDEGKVRSIVVSKIRSGLSPFLV